MPRRAVPGNAKSAWAFAPTPSREYLGRRGFRASDRRTVGTRTALRRIGAIALAAGCALTASAPAATPAREWGEPAPLNQGATDIERADLTYTRPGELLAVFGRMEGGPPTIVAATKAAGAAEFGEAQVLDAHSYLAQVEGDGGGGAVAAWYREGGLPAHRIAIKEPGRPFGEPVTYPGDGGDYSESRPRVAVNRRGDAIVVFNQEHPDGGERIWAAYRPAGGEFGPREPVHVPDGGAVQVPRDVAISPTGEAVIAWLENGVTHVATRPPNGPIGAPQAYGEPCADHCWRLPQVGVDALGNAALIYFDGTGGDYPLGPVHLAFRRAGDKFGKPIDLGITTGASDNPHLAVSALGEMVIAIEDVRDNPYGGATIYALRAAFGLTAGQVVGPFGVVREWTYSHSQMGMNQRGDTVLAWDARDESKESWPLVLSAARKLAAGSFVPESRVVGPIEIPPGGRGGLAADDVAVDAFGNAAILWRDFEPRPTLNSVSEDGPIIAVEPPEVELWELIPPLFEEILGAVPPKLPPVDIPPPPAVPLPPIELSGATATPADRRPPALRVRPAGVLESGRTWLTLSCSEACSARVTGYVRTRGAKRAAALSTLAVNLDRAGRKRLALTLSRKQRRSIAAAIRKGTASLTLNAVATDAATNVSRAKKTVRLTLGR